MSDSNLSSDLDALLQQLDDLQKPPMPEAPVRIVVATDWSDAAPALTLLRAFRAIISPDLGVQLAFAVPHAPSAHDAECVRVLLEGSDVGESLDNLEVLSFDEASSQPYDSALVPNGDTAQLVAQVGGVIVRMHDLVRRFERGGRDDTMNRGDAAALADRLTRFSA